MQISKAQDNALVFDSALDARPTGARFKVLSLLFALAALTYLDRLCISAAAPAIMQEFRFTPVQMGYIFSAFTLTYALFEIPSGWFGDYFRSEERRVGKECR